MTNQPPEYPDPQGATPPGQTGGQPYASPTMPNYEAADPAAPYAPYGSTPGYPAAPGYGAVPAYGTGLPQHPQATTILVLGILSLFVAITGPFAWYMGSKARKEIAAGRYAESGSVTAGWVLGIIGTIYMIVVAVAVIIKIIGMIGLMAASG